MPATLEIGGTRLPIRVVMNAEQRVSELKQLICTLYRVPLHRMSFRLHHGGGQLMSDDQTLESYGIMAGGPQHVHLLVMHVEPADVPITVYLRSLHPQFEHWEAVVQCKETITLAQFKRLVADQLRWAEPDGMAIFRGGFGGRIDGEEGNMGRPIREFLIVDSCGVWVEFRTNVPQNGTRPHQIQLPPPPPEEAAM